MLRKRFNDQHGFTVVEVMVAGLILGIGVLGSASIFDSSRRESATGERLQVAQALAEAELERMRDVPYAQLATNEVEAWPSSGTSGDPANRVVTGTDEFRAGEGAEGTEPLVLADSGTGIDPFSEPENVTVDGASFKMQVYRFVSWRDVECQVVDLTPFKTEAGLAIDDLLMQIDTGSAYVDTLLGNISGPLLTHPLLSNFRGKLQSFKSSTLGQLDNRLDALWSAIDNLEEIDPCDINVETLNEINDLLDVLGPALEVVDTALLNARNAQGCARVLLVVVCPSATQNAYNTAIAQMAAFTAADWGTSINDVIDSIEELDAADHGFNTKRVTVAIVLDPTSGSGPYKPVWVTSIVSDPEAGVLGG